MKLATLKSESRDGCLAVVDRTLEKAVTVASIAPTLQAALDDWERIETELEQVYRRLNQGGMDAAAFDPAGAAAPLPRAYQWLDGSAYLSHVERVRKSRGAEMPASFLSDPLMYQGGSDSFLGARDPVRVADPADGIDFEAEVAVITGDVPMGVDADSAASCIRLVTLVNDVSLRNRIPAELAKGFGFLTAKPSSAFAPVVVTPDELGQAWNGRRLSGCLQVDWNGERFGNADCGRDLQFDFADLIRHAASTRSLVAGTIIGSGTVSNRDSGSGYSCIVEKRVVEILSDGAPSTRFMAHGDRVRIEMLDRHGDSIFGAISQSIEPCP